MSDTTPWVLKYSPKSVDDMVLTKSLADLFNGIVKTKRLSNLAIFGSPGIGKTTLAKIIVDSLGCDYWVQPCSADGSIDMVKTSVKNFCEIVPKGEYKVVILDEADQLSQQAQMALRNMIVDSMDNCRFILTANYQDKVIEALKSRCTPIKLEFSSKDVLKRCVGILKREGVSVDKETMREFYEEVIVKKYPDIRSTIEHLQMMAISGALKILRSEDAKVQDEMVMYVHDSLTSGKASVREIRGHLLANEDKFSADYVKLAQGLFDAFDDSAEAMAIIADALWRMSFQLDKEIQFVGMLIGVMKVLKGK